MATFQRGQLLVGLRLSYRLVEPAHRRTNNVWIASLENGQSGAHPEKVVIKTASQVLLHNETKHLNTLRGNHRIRQMIDSIESPPSIVLEYVEEDLPSLSIRRKLQRIEIKAIARQLLEAMAIAHEKNIVHTDLKPQNILISGFTHDFKCSEASVKLADFANNWFVNDGSLWGSLWIFSRNEEDAEIEMLRKQNSMTGPYPLALLKRAGGGWPALFQVFADMDKDQGECVTWRWVMKELQLPEEDGAFIERVLKIDPAERPTAEALLKDEWFAEPKFK